MNALAGKVAIVTGASKGTGAGIAKGLAEAGASVVVNDASSREGAERVVVEIENAGGKATAVQADISNIADVEKMFDKQGEIALQPGNGTRRERTCDDLSNTGMKRWIVENEAVGVVFE